MTKKLEEEMREDLPLQEAEETSPPQTDTENAELIMDPPEDGVSSQDNAASPQTGSENQPDVSQEGPDGVIDPEKAPFSRLTRNPN